MFRDGTNQKAVYEWVKELSVNEERCFDVQDKKREGQIINDTLARVYISSISKVIGRKYKTRTILVDGLGPRLFVLRKE